MINYTTVNAQILSDGIIDHAYADLLNSKAAFCILNTADGFYILTKEKSFFKTDNLQEFIKQANEDVYFKTVESENGKYSRQDLDLYHKYLNEYKNQMSEKHGLAGYLFGTVAINSLQNNMITTTRGKDNLKEFTLVTGVDFDKQIVHTHGKKATLNAPLLYNLFKIDGVKSIVHTHQFDESLPFLPYANPGTIRDSLRKVNGSFNISAHGVFKLFDESEKLIIGGL